MEKRQVEQFVEDQRQLTKEVDDLKKQVHKLRLQNMKHRESYAKLTQKMKTITDENAKMKE